MILTIKQLELLNNLLKLVLIQYKYESFEPITNLLPDTAGEDQISPPVVTGCHCDVFVSVPRQYIFFSNEPKKILLLDTDGEDTI